MLLILDKVNSQSRRNMGFAGSSATNKYQVVCRVRKFASLKVFKRLLIYCRFFKLKATKIFVMREFSRFDLIVEAPDFTFCTFSVNQLFNATDKLGGLDLDSNSGNCCAIPKSFKLWSCSTMSFIVNLLSGSRSDCNWLPAGK